MTEDRPVADGIVDKGPDGSTQVRFVRRLPRLVARVWAALTGPAELRRWWGDADLDLADGGRFALRWFNTDENGDVATLDGAITKLDPPRLLEITAAWGSTGSDDPDVPTTLTWELDPDGDPTLLRFTNTVHPAHRRSDTGSMSRSAGEGSGPPWALLAGVLFDSGDVLVRPTSPNDAPATEAWRRWFGGPWFVATIHAHLPGLRLDDADQAFAAGMRYLDDRHRQPLGTVAEERARFTGFYRVVLERLGVQDPPPALLRALVEGEDDEIAIEPFPEAVGVLERLRGRGLRLGVLTENWPSVEIAYQRLGLRSLFCAFVISSQEGRLKDDPELFAIAAARMGLPAGAVLFVDDWPPHVQTALAAGFQGAVLDRNAEAPTIPGLRYLTDLHDVERLVMAATLPPSPA